MARETKLQLKGPPATAHGGPAVGGLLRPMGPSAAHEDPAAAHVLGFSQSDIKASLAGGCPLPTFRDVPTPLVDGIKIIPCAEKDNI